MAVSSDEHPLGENAVWLCSHPNLLGEAGAYAVSEFDLRHRGHLRFYAEPLFIQIPSASFIRPMCVWAGTVSFPKATFWRSRVERIAPDRSRTHGADESAPNGERFQRSPFVVYRQQAGTKIRREK
jgi:hypothetical protein